jgi:RNA polymerase sigma-70 factor (ECF subfamily)
MVYLKEIRGTSDAAQGGPVARAGRQMFEFEEVYEEFYPEILRYLSRMAGEEVAEDIAQETFVKVNRGLESFKGGSKLSTWVYRIATNAALDRLRSPALKHTVELPMLDEGAEGGDMDAWSDEKRPAPDQTAIRREMNECIREFIEKLPPDFKTVIVLSEIEGFKNREIADTLDISLDNVKMRLHRARAGLKNELEEGCSFYHDERNTLACDRKDQ